MPREESERFKIDAPFDEAMARLLGVDTDGDGEGDDGQDDDA